MIRARRPSEEKSPAALYLLEYDANDDADEKDNFCQKWKCCIITTIIIIVVLVLLIFLIIFVALPLVFMYSIDVQRDVLFRRTCDEGYEFTNFQKYGIESARNLYVPVSPNVSLGVWHLLPLKLVYEAAENDNYNFTQTLYRTTLPVLLYFHDITSINRIIDKNKYVILRRHFHVITFDYRNYGDSSPADLFEIEIVEDCVQLYNWLKTQTRAPIYVWGHSFGAAIATNMIRTLRKESTVPTGLFLESPFTNVREELPHFPVTKLFSWLVWFDATILSPIEKNGFVFKTEEYLLSVDCPIMIVQAEDNLVVPYALSEKLYKIGKEMRDEETQGTVTFHLYPGHFGYGHTNLYEARELSDQINNHIEVCKAASKGRV